MADDDEHLELRAVEDTLNERAPKRAWNSYEYAIDFERNRRRRGLAPKPLIAPRPPMSPTLPVDFIAFNELAPAAEPRSCAELQSRAGHITSANRWIETDALIAAGVDYVLRAGGTPNHATVADVIGRTRETVIAHGLPDWIT
jgi:hypothetical protein